MGHNRTYCGQKRFLMKLLWNSEEQEIYYVMWELRSFGLLRSE